MVDRLDLLDTRDLGQSAQPLILPPRENIEPLTHEGTVYAVQWSHVAQGAERGEIKMRHDVW
jgi:hypothetical protein